MFVVAYGNPFDGVTLVGPFPTAEEGNEWADQHLDRGDWWCVPMASIGEEDA